MILRFLSLVSAVYFFHRKTQKYLGVEKRQSSSFNQIVPVSSPDKASDFTIKQGKVYSRTDVMESRMSSSADQPKDQNLRIFLANKNQSWNAESGVDRDGNNLIAYDSFSSHLDPYQFRLILLGDRSFAIGWKGRCMIYNEKGDNFKTGSCSNIEDSTFYVAKEK